MRHFSRLHQATIILALMFCASSVAAQGQSDKKPLTMDDYDSWRSVSSTAISDNGQWVTFSYRQFEQNDTLYVQNLETDQEYTIPMASRPSFSDDSNWLAYMITLPFEEAEKLRDQRKPVPNKAGLLNLESGEKLTWENAASFSFPKGSSHFLIGKAQADRDAEHDGTDIILRNLQEGYEELIGSVGAFSFNKPGTVLAYTVDAADQSGNGIYFIMLDSGSRRPLDNGSADYTQLTWDEEGSAIAVLKGTEVDTLEHPLNTLLAFTGVTGRRMAEIVYDPSDDPGFSEGMIIAAGGLTWSEDLSKIFFSIRSQEKKEKEKDADEEANVRIFHYQDEGHLGGLIGQFEELKNMTFRSVLQLSERKFLQLTDQEMRSISITRDGTWGIGQNDRAYISDWKERQADYYRVNIETGERTLFLEGHISGLSSRGFRGGGASALSPDSEHYLYWENGHIWDYRLDDGRKTNLTESASVSFANAEWDNTGTRPPYGISGWTEDGRSVILTHRYDLWLQPLNGNPATNLTGGRGAEDEIVLRYIRTDPEARFVDLNESILLSAYGQWTKKSGFFELEDGDLTQLVFEDCKFGGLTRAGETDTFLYTRQTFADFPDYYVSDDFFSGRRRITEANPQQSEYLWGHSVLIDYTNDDGVRLQAVLAVPDDYQQGQKRPMVVRFYEKMSQNLHSYPSPRHSNTPQFADYVSHGYLFLLPDVHFRTGSSHTDMLECIEAATSRVIELGYAEPEHIGLNGGSYSGGGSCYIATRSTMFAAVVARAAPINLVAEFNVPFSGALNNHQYDIHGQGRYGVSPYEDMEMYREQSPITFVETMDTPLLYLHGEDDGAVQWLQGVEFYNALRFLGKPVIMCSYPGEGHSLGRMPNRKDYEKRIHQFYDHYLKGEPAAPWMLAQPPDPEKN